MTGRKRKQWMQNWGLPNGRGGRGLWHVTPGVGWHKKVRHLEQQGEVNTKQEEKAIFWGYESYPCDLTWSPHSQSPWQKLQLTFSSCFLLLRQNWMAICFVNTNTGFRINGRHVECRNLCPEDTKPMPPKSCTIENTNRESTWQRRGQQAC